MENRLEFTIDNPIYLSVSEAAKFGGVGDKTIRRALKKTGNLKFKIVNNRYQIDLASLIVYLHKNTKLENKLYKHGFGQYIKEWKKDKNPPTKITYKTIAKNRLDS